MSYSVIELT